MKTKRQKMVGMEGGSLEGLRGDSERKIRIYCNEGRRRTKIKKKKM